MSSSGGLTSSPLKQDLGFNWIFLVELNVCGILTLFFLFYFNRVFASCVSWSIRKWTWHVHRVYIDIQALQISLLGGRIFFKGLRYHGNNETILIQSGFVTWRYWLRNVKELDIGSSQNATKGVSSDIDEGRPATFDGEGNGGQENPAKLPCRIDVTLSGVEWFVYNRSAAYDSIVAGLTESLLDHSPPTPDDSEAKLRKRSRNHGEEQIENVTERSPGVEQEGSPLTDKSTFLSEETKMRKVSTVSQARDSDATSGSRGSSDGPFILRFLPIHITCQRAAVVLGNENTKSVLVTKVDSATGEIDAAKATSSLDQYRQLIAFQFMHPVIQMKPNEDFKEDQTAAASRMKRGEASLPNFQHLHSHSVFHRQRKKVWHRLQDLVPAFRSSVDSLSSGSYVPLGTPSQRPPGSNSWQGLSRYLDESQQDDKARWSSIEYATVSTIADCAEANMCFYWDAVGTVRERSRKKQERHAANINGDIAPEWGINLTMKGGIINYGPWADRQRADIQRVFFPSLCKDAVPHRDLVAGQLRVPTEFKLYLEFEEGMTLRVPIKEESKNWKWAKQADTMGATPSSHKRTMRGNRKRKTDKGNPGPEVRPFGWVDIRVGANATVSYIMDMVAGSSGFSNKLNLELPSMEITTSVNHGTLWRSVENEVVCDLSNPLQWNGFRTWKFDVRSSGLELFILREHVFLLTDLVDDWASGPPPEYLTFSPFKYMINLELADFRIYLNVNDSNIINNPSDFDDNTFIVIFGSALDAGIAIPLEDYRPHRNDIPFKVSARQGGLNLHVPPWNTQATYMDSTEVASFKKLEMDGKYQYCATTSTSNTDTLLLNVYGLGATAKFFGFVIRYFLKVKDNYFGDDIRFKTLEEYRDLLRANQRGEGETSNPQPPHKKSNDLDVVLSISGDGSSVVLPSNLYLSKNHIRIDIATLAVDLRFTNYYMDLEVVFSTLAFSQGSDDDDDGTTTPISNTSSTQLFIDGINVYGNRLFGLPPTEPTYICNWDFAVGTVTGECTSGFLNRLANGGRAFGFSLDDDENALPPISEPVIHDVTFLRASVESVRIWLHVEETAFLFATDAISVKFNDWAGSHYSKKLKLLIPGLQIGCVDAESASRHRSRTQHPVETHALLETALSFTMIQRNLGFEEDRQLQQEHIKRHDQRTNRTQFLLQRHLLDDSMLTPVDPPAMSIPPMPLPIIHDEGSLFEEESLKSTKRSFLRNGKPTLKRKSSFLSTSSSSQKSSTSIVRPRSTVKLDEAQSVRSRSVQTSLAPGRRLSARDISASTGRHSSFYSAVGDNRGLPQSTVMFSSSYAAPYFPLESVEPDARDLPKVLKETFERSDGPKLGLSDINPDRVDDQSGHVNLMLEFPAGIQGVFNSKAVNAIVSLISAVQATEPADLLDRLQMESTDAIIDMRKQNISASNVIDLGIYTPAIDLRFMNSSTSTKTSHDNMNDQYDLSVSKLSSSLRFGTIAAKNSNLDVKKHSAAHVSLASAGLAAKERFNDREDSQAAINCLIEDLVFWAASKETASINVVFKGFELATASSKIEYLASILNRTKLLAVELEESFTSQLKKQRNRVQLFTYLVATVGQRVADPLFLTRPSDVLRSAPDHLRTTDSWKIVSRLHHMYDSLELSTRQGIAVRCLSNTEALPSNAQQQVQAEFERWRSWDLNNINGCLLMVKVYGNSKESLADSPAQSLIVSLRTEYFRLVVDPGPKQNDVIVSNISAVIEVKNLISSKNINPEEDAQLNQQTIVQAFCADASINLNWELCELAEDIINLYNESESKLKSSPISSVSEHDEVKHNSKQNLQILFATEKGSITIETINIRFSSINKGLKASFLMLVPADGAFQNSMTLMLAAEAVTSKIQSHSQELTVYQLRYPTIYASYEIDVPLNPPANIFKVAGNCQDLSFVIRQDILALIDVLDLVVGDEVARIYRLSQRKPSAKVSNIQTPTVKLPSEARINVTLFLDKYVISVPLLHSFTHIVSGVVARASLVAQMDSEILFDFDVKEHSHDIQMVSSNKAKSIAQLYMPPTNGRITTQMSAEETTVSVMATVEPVELDATAVHSLLTALDRPEISSVISDVKDDLSAIQSHLAEIFGSEKGISPRLMKGKENLFIYDVHLTLAGLDIFANGPDQDLKTARLDLSLGCIKLLIANRLEQNGPALEYPELRMDMRHIILELTRWSNNTMEPCGNLSFTASLTATTKLNDTRDEARFFHLKSDGLEVNLFADTASSVVDVLGHLQHKIKDLELSREKNYLRKLRKPKKRFAINDKQEALNDISPDSKRIFASMYSLELLNIQISWLVGTYETGQLPIAERENLVLSLKRIDLSTRRENSARLAIEDLQMQMVPVSHDKSQRSLNSALLPEIIFNVGYVSTPDTRRFAFQAAGKSLDLRLTSQFMIPGSDLAKSIGYASDRVKAATASWATISTGPANPTEMTRRQPFFGKKRLESLLIDADFAGAVVYLSCKKASEPYTLAPGTTGDRAPQNGKYSQFTHEDASSNTALRAPGLAWKVEYKDNGLDDPSLNAEVKVEESSNILYPSVVPLIMEITASVKEVVSDDEGKKPSQAKPSPQKFMSVDEDNILTTDPSAVLGRTRLNLGLRICRQEFGLSCQPIARVAATARFDDIYLTINTVRSTEHGHFFAASAAFTRLQASVQHVYSRESTGSFDVDSVFLSLINSKHVSGTSGVSAILKISPMKVLVNAKQLQDFLLFREIWVPPETRQSTPGSASTAPSTQSQTFLVQRYQQVAATGAFPWNATVSIAELDVQLDLGQAIGKSAFIISNFWISSKKNSDWEQNLCVGFDRVGVDSTGRMSGFVALQDFGVRTSIKWPDREMALNQTPLIQGSLSFSQLRVKAAFDYQAFLVADITSFKFLMYNIRSSRHAKGDRLVAILDGEAVQVLCTTTTASQCLALYQAFERLIQEKRSNYETSLAEIEKFMKRRSMAQHSASAPKSLVDAAAMDKVINSPISLHTDVIVTLKAVTIGAFPSTFSDHQVFKLEALDAQARFTVTMDHGKIHSILGLTLGQLRIGLAGVRQVDPPKSVGEISVEDVVNSATRSHGPTILGVPRVEATMQTWQVPNSNHIDYIFRSFFEGKVDVGWNYSRISYIRSMYASHTKALAQRLGKPLPPSAVTLTGVPDEERKEGVQDKITAKVNVPQSKYEYTALEPPIIETPQLRSMGEATPPLEWIGLHRDRLPNLTHQIVIVTLLELASEVEDAYGKILGSS
ncbi:hypothetical protein JHW43_001745 [Diplocarpon mali]|nr:hypothetical protein JHW43_001745 [Diplocarpon mali]